MDNSTNDMSGKLVQYLDGELPENEKAGLEKRLAADQTLQEELENLRLAREAVRSYGLKQQVAGIHQKMMSELPAPVSKINHNRRLIRYGIAIAASVLIVFLASTLFNSGTLSSDKLFADNYHSYELSTARNGVATETAIEKVYRAKDYTNVTRLADTSNSTKELFLCGMSWLELKNTSEAVRKFEKVISINEVNNGGGFKEESEYYMALALILGKQYDHAVKIMQQIKDNPDHLYHERITEKLIKDVKKLI